MAFGGNRGGFRGKGGSSSPWMHVEETNQWNLRAADPESEESWNQPAPPHNISNNLEWQMQSRIPVNNNKNKRKSNTSKNASRVDRSSREDDFQGSQSTSEGLDRRSQRNASVEACQRTKFTSSSMQNGLNSNRQSVQAYQDQHIDVVERNASHTKKLPRRDVNDQKTCIKNISKNVDWRESEQMSNEIINQLPNANEILERLLQIREYMKQVASTIDTLQKSGDHRVIERMQMLQKIHSDLQRSEQQLMGLLDKISDMQNDHRQLSVSGKTETSSDDSEGGEFAVEDYSSMARIQTSDPGSQNVDKSQVVRRNDLLKKVAESQEKLKALQDQQAMLIALQQKAENRLSQAKAMRNHPTNSNTEELCPVELEKIASCGLQDDLESLQDRLDALKDLYDNRDRAESMSRVGDEGKLDDSEMLTEIQRQELQNKLQDLQEKKRYMDSLLQELKTLQTIRSQEMMNNSEVFSERVKDGVSVSTTARQTLENAQEVLESIDSNEKFSKLKDMRSRLRHLQELVANYQPEQSSEIEEFAQNTNTQLVTINPSISNEQPGKCRNQTEDHFRKTQKNDNISREHSSDLKIDNSQKDEVEDNVENACWEEGDANAQFRKLQLAKDKLCRMQDLLFALKDKRESSADDMEIVHQLLENLEKEEEHARSFAAQSGQGDHYSESGDSPFAEENFPKERKRRSGFVMVRPEDQPQMNIDHLIEESHRLLQLQENFNTNQKHPNNIEMVGPSSANRIQRFVAGQSEAQGYVQTRSIPSAKRNEQKESVRLKQDQRNINSMQKIPVSKQIQLDNENNGRQLVTSNHEIWSEVRQRFILREELRQKKRELEELMKKDKGKSNSRNQDNMSDNVSYSNKSDALGLSYVGTEGTTVATWGGSTQGNLDEDQEVQNESQEEMDDEIDENEAYSSEEIVEPVATTSAPERNNNRFLGAKDRKGLSNGMVDITSCGDKGTVNITSSPKGTVEFKDTRKTWEKVSLTQDTVHNWNNHSNLRQPQPQIAQVANGEEQEHENVPHASSGLRQDFTSTWQQHVFYFLQQLEQTNMLHHSILRDQSCLANLLQQMTSLNTATQTPATSEPLRPQQVPDILQNLNHQLQQQQQLVNLHQCYHFLYLQQLEIQQLRQLQHLNDNTPTNTSDDATGRSTNTMDIGFPPMIPPTLFAANPLITTSVAQHTPSGPESSNNLFSTNFLSHDQLGQCSQTLNNQVVPGIRTNNYWDNFRSYSRQNLLSASSGNKSGDNDVLNSRVAQVASILQNSHMIAQDGIMQTASTDQRQRECLDFPTLQRHTLVGREAMQHLTGQNSGIPKFDLGVPNSKKGQKEKVNENTNNHTTDGRNEFRSTIVSEGIPVVTNDVQNFSANAQQNSTGASSNALAFDSSCPTFANKQSDDLNGRSLFETLRESIYAEVAVLISQNETRPHFLIQMFKELQKLNSDYLRQNALMSLSELITHLTSSSAEMISPKSQGHRLERRSGEYATYLDLTSREGIATSDEEEIRSRLFNLSKSIQKLDGAACNQQTQEDNLVVEDCLDMKMNVSNATDKSPKSSLAETSIHFSKTKEGKARRQNLFSLNCTSSPVPSVSTSFPSLSEESPLCNLNSEASASELQYVELNYPKQLDDEIQAIMMEVVPFLKAHLEDKCSSKLLARLLQLIISLVSQRDQAMELHVFKKKLTSILQSALNKYTGKRLRDCGEQLLVDTSEILFSELALVHHRYNVDNNCPTMKTRSFQAVSQSFSNIENILKKDGPFLNDNRKTMPPTSEATDADECIFPKMEDDELGQSRDDAMAANCDIFDTEDVSRASSNNSVRENVFIEHSESSNDQNSADVVVAAASPLIPAANELQNNKQDFHIRIEAFGEADNETEEGLEDNLDLAEADQPQNFLVLERSQLQTPSLDSQAELIPSKENANTEATEDDQEQHGPINDGSQECREVLGAEGGIEHGLDEIPIKLLPLFQRDLSANRTEEERANNLVDEILNDSVEAELADTTSIVRQPDTP